MTELEREMLVEEMTVPGVSRELAAHRRARLRNLSYELDLHLPAEAANPVKPAELAGRLRLAFELADNDWPLILDFRDLDQAGQIVPGRVSGLTVNDAPVIATSRHGHLVIPESSLDPGCNQLQIDFRSTIAAAGRPLIRFSDEGDGTASTYLLSVPMDASLAFPCFDQPDLKGTFRLTLTAPTGLTVVSNGDLARTETDGPATRHEFAVTPPLSTYLFSFAAGPFAVIADHIGDRPLRLFVRQSQLERATAAWPAIRELTASGLRWLEDYLDFPFPFSKYDQVLLPGFPFRGMEHAGATFLREEAVLFAATPTRGDQLNRAALILHELVHQWFGDLVTMRWFDDLWLKEGFANYLAYLTMAAIRPLGLDEWQIWQRFHLTHKPAATAIDRSGGATPLHQPVPNLRDAKSAYGAIVYQKAPSLLRALSFTLGAEAFRDGARLLLRRHAFDNADWRDFSAAFETASGHELGEWCRVWLTTAGMPRIDLDWQWREIPRREGGELLIRLTQHDRDGTNRRWPIRTCLHLGFADGSSRLITTRLDDRQATLAPLRLRQPPAYVFANGDDHAYGQFMLDPQSRAALIERLTNKTSGEKDPWRRTLHWSALWESMVEGEIDPAESLALILRTIPDESDADLFQLQLERLTRLTERLLPRAAEAQLAPQVEEVLFNGLLTAGSADQRLLCFRTFRRLASTATGRERLRALLAQPLALIGLELTPADRWPVIGTLLALDDPAAEELLAAELERDQSPDRARQAWIAGAARPDRRVKNSYFAEYLRHDGLPEDWIEGSLVNFNHRHQASLTFDFLRPALEALPGLKERRKIFFILAWLDAFIGGQPAEHAFPVIEDFLTSSSLDADLVAKVRQVGGRARGEGEGGGRRA